MSRSALSYCLPVALIACCAVAEEPSTKQWLAGDNHVHSQYSVVYDRKVSPPKPIPGIHAIYQLPGNAQVALQYGLSWMVATDHGGRLHAKIDLDQAYPDLLLARETVPEVIQFFGFELNTPGADHSSIVVPHSHDEAQQVHQLESRFDKLDADPADEGSNTTERMIDALSEMQLFPVKPVVIANHPSRGARDGKKYGLSSPSVLRRWNNAAPEIAVGMAGSPGRQATTLNADGTPRIDGKRGAYTGQPTFGGFDIMTAELGGFWDSMLGESRHWWITANSDSHINWRDGGNDFYPGEFSKTYVFANKNHDSILSALRSGKVFVTTGDLVSELFVTVTTEAGESVDIGGTLHVNDGDIATITIRLRDPDGENHHGDEPAVSRVDLIVGDVSGMQDDPDHHSNPSTRVLRRFSSDNWTREGEFLTMTEQVGNTKDDYYVRVRGTNTEQLEPEPDVAGEDPWRDLWFYSNPVFVNIK